MFKSLFNGNQRTEPPLPGLFVRGFRGERDLHAMSALAAGATEIDAIPAGISYAQNPNLDRDVLIVELDGVIIGYGWVRWWPEPDGSWLYYHRGYLQEDVHGMGIGTYLLSQTEGRLRELAAWHTDRSRVMLGADVASAARPTARLLTGHGYTPTHVTAEMTLQPEVHLPSAYLPGGFNVQPATMADAHTIWAMKTAGWHSRPTDGHLYRVFVQDSDPAMWITARTADDLAGVVLTEIRRGIGLVTDILVAEAYRGLGLERGLLLHAVHHLRQRGTGEVRLFTEVETTLHETVGFRLRETYTRYLKPMG
ncbi:MAG: GNAT family N-acetyltransferase [Chloroflexi bacterium]|nr:GNAT family N-acetyltransferase [Chloroflexota bacterium]